MWGNGRERDTTTKAVPYCYSLLNFTYYSVSKIYLNLIFKLFALHLTFILIVLVCFLQLTRAYFAFLEVLFSSHIVFILNLDTNTFMHIAGSLESGLKGLDTNISSQVCLHSFSSYNCCYSFLSSSFFLFFNQWLFSLTARSANGLILRNLENVTLMMYM